MASSIDATKPISGNPTTLSVRSNFSAAKSEIEDLQSTKAPIASPTFTGTATIPTAVITSLTFNGVAITATGTEINSALDGITVTAAQLNAVTALDGLTATAAELNKLDGATVTTAEINILDGVTATTAEINKLDGVTATTTEINYVDGVTSNIQTQLNAKAPVASPTFTGTATSPTVNATSSLQVGGTALCTGFTRFWEGTQAAYDALTPDANTVYFITA